jgi:pimeloyl-ACP methyl ester carboxylesterase
MWMIVFVHGVPDTPALWEPLIAALGLKPGEWLAPAMPGFGTPVPAGFTCTKDAYAAWLIADLEKTARAAGGPVHLVGHDWGALLVLRAACLRPDLIASWAVTNAVIDLDYRGHQNARIWATPILGEISMLAIRNKARIETALVAAGMPAALAKSEVPHIDKTMRQSILKLYRSADGLRFKGPWVDDLAKLPCKGVIFWGATDIFVQLAVAERFATQRNFPLHTAPASGHWACHESAPQFAEVLKAHWSN